METHMLIDTLIKNKNQRAMTEDTSCVGIFSEPVETTDEVDPRIAEFKEAVPEERIEQMKARYGESWEEVLDAVAKKQIMGESDAKQKYKTTRDVVGTAYGDATRRLRTKPFSNALATQLKDNLTKYLTDAGLKKSDAKGVVDDALTLRAQETRGSGTMTFLELKYVARAAANRGLIGPVDNYGRAVAESLDEAKKQETYFDTYSAAVQYALDLIPSNLTYNDDEYHNIVASGTKKPGKDKTTSFKLPLYKGDKHVKLLVVNVYNRGSDKNPYELNAYVS